MGDMVPVSLIATILRLNQYRCSLQTANRLVNVYPCFQVKFESGHQNNDCLVIYNR